MVSKLITFFPNSLLLLMEKMTGSKNVHFKIMIPKNYETSYQNYFLNISLQLIRSDLLARALCRLSVLNCNHSEATRFSDTIS